MPLYLHEKISNNTMPTMDKIKLLLEKKESLLYLINRHAQNKDRIWEGDEKGFTDYINAALDEINEINNEIKELLQDDSSLD